MPPPLHLDPASFNLLCYHEWILYYVCIIVCLQYRCIYISSAV